MLRIQFSQLSFLMNMNHLKKVLNELLLKD